MTDPTRHETDLLLRRLLQAGDPAADDRDPDPAELNRWRRQTLTAAETGSSTAAWWRPLLPVAAVTAVAFLAALFLLLPPTEVENSAPIGIAVQTPAGDSVPAPGIQPAREPDGPDDVAPPQVPPAPQSVPPGDPPEPGPLLLAGQRPGEDAGLSADAEQKTSPSPSPVPPAPDSPAANVVLAAARTVQFTAPGGTRVIWTLNPELELPTEGGSL